MRCEYRCAKDPPQGAAPVVGHEDRPLQSERLDQRGDVVGEREDVVAAPGALGLAVAAKVRRVKASLAELAHHRAPAHPPLGESVEAQHRRPIGAPRHRHVEGDAVRPDLSVLDVRRHDFSVASAARVGRLRASIRAGPSPAPGPRTSDRRADVDPRDALALARRPPGGVTPLAARQSQGRQEAQEDFVECRGMFGRREVPSSGNDDESRPGNTAMGGVRRNPVERPRQFPSRNGHWHPDLAQLGAGDRGRRRASKRKRSRIVEQGCANGGGQPLKGPRLTGHSVDKERTAAPVSPALVAMAAGASMSLRSSPATWASAGSVTKVARPGSNTNKLLTHSGWCTASTIAIAPP